MARPIYENENPQWRIAQDEFKYDIEQITGFRLEPLPRPYGADYIAFKGTEPYGLFELKCRSFESTKFAETIIPLQKVVTCLIYANFLLKPFFFWVKWTDRIGYIQIVNDTSKTIRINKNYTRDDPADNEPGIMIPITKFIFL